MILLLALVTGIVVSVAVRQAGSTERPWRKAVFSVGLVALLIRLAAMSVIYAVARQAHVEGVWLNDEASFFLAAQSLLPNPLDSSLPAGLDHLGGDGYLGLTTVVSMAFGDADSNAFRLINCGLATLVVLLSMMIARTLFGFRAGVVAGLGLALWPFLVLWSATMLRDTLGGFCVVAMWWALLRAREATRVHTAGAVLLGLILVFGLRPYLGGAMLAGALAWAIYPHARRLHTWQVVAVISAVVVVGGGLAMWRARQIDFAAHELIYRQTVTRMETLGRLYTDFPPDATNLPIKPGSAVAIADPATGWLLTGVVQDVPRENTVQVAFVDESIRQIPLEEIQFIEDAPIPPLQLVAWVGPNLASFIFGTPMAGGRSSFVWTVSALGWDLVLIAAIGACLRSRVSGRIWAFPAAVIGATVLALVAIPGAPGNADRHRTTQTLPLLVVLASGLSASRMRAGFIVNKLTSKPANAPTAAISRMRSAR